MPARRARPTPGRLDGPPPDAVADPPADPESVARTLCLRMLTLRPRTRAELAEALRRRGVPDEPADAVLGRFGEVGLIDDAAFAATWVQSRHTTRGLARRVLAEELRARGVDREVAQEALDLLEPDTEESTARALVNRRLAATRRLPTDVRLRRLVSMLARKGYPPAMALRVVREQVAADGGDLAPELLGDELAPDA